MAGFNLDAILGELEDKPLIYKGETFHLAAELPGAALAPFLNPDLGLIDLVAEIFADDDALEDPIEFLISALQKRPTIPVDLLAAAKDSLTALFTDDAEGFYALVPSVNAYWAIARNVATEYGFSLTGFFGSAASSGSDGESSKATSSESSGSTPATSGDEPTTPAASVPAAS